MYPQWGVNSRCERHWCAHIKQKVKIFPYMAIMSAAQWNVEVRQIVATMSRKRIGCLLRRK